MHIHFSGNRLEMSDGDSFKHIYSALWLRESSNSEDFRDPKTGHKIGNGDLLPLDITITKADVEDDNLLLNFSDGHQSEFALEWLQERVIAPFSQELIGKKTLWGSNLDPLPWYSLQELKNDQSAVLAALNDVARSGFILVRDMPLELNGMQEFIDLIGYMRVTNNGAIEDIKAVPPAQAYDLSMTPRALEPHTDNPYRIPQPGYVLLHCIENEADGGESGLTDGFRAAEELRKTHPEEFTALCNTPVNWFYRDDQAILEDTSTFIELDSAGHIKHVRFHGRSDRVAVVDADQLDTFYAARRRFINLITSDELELRFKLRAGDMFLLDNYRLIHSRKAFKLSTGARHMRQAYIDRDVVSSRQKTLLRDVNTRPWVAR